MEAQEETLLVLKEHSTLVHKAGWLVCVPLPLPHEARPRDTPWARRYVIGHMPLFEATGTRRTWMRRAPPCSSRSLLACLLACLLLRRASSAPDQSCFHLLSKKHMRARQNTAAGL
jgi:hypothetical protein